MSQSSNDLDDLVAILGSHKVSSDVKMEPCEHQQDSFCSSFPPTQNTVEYCQYQQSMLPQCPFNNFDQFSLSNIQQEKMVIKQEPVSYPPYPFDNNFQSTHPQNHVRPHELPLASYHSNLTMKHTGYPQHHHDLYTSNPWNCSNGVPATGMQNYRSMPCTANYPLTHHEQLNLQVRYTRIVLSISKILYAHV